MTDQQKADAVADILNGKPSTGRRYRILTCEKYDTDWGVVPHTKRWYTKYRVERRRLLFFWGKVENDIDTLQKAYKAIEDDVAERKRKDEQRRRGRWQRVEVL